MRFAFWFIAGTSLMAADVEQRALDFLSREVPRWATENRCYSCHNNGDAARALFLAIRHGRKIDLGSVNDTVKWLASPKEWDKNRGDPVISDKKLARIQFTAALAAAVEAGLAKTPPLAEAARTLVHDQDPDGAWRTEGSQAGLGSPVTYGMALGTYMAMHAVKLGGEKESAQRALKWFEKFQPKSNMDLSASLLALSRPALAEKLVKAQNRDGGWGPYPATPSEAFDTALAMIALHRAGDRDAVGRGRAFLMRTQLESGSWRETTRPAGNQSYAQHISTAGWAVLALIESSARER